MLLSVVSLRLLLLRVCFMAGLENPPKEKPICLPKTTVPTSPLCLLQFALSGNVIHTKWAPSLSLPALGEYRGLVERALV